MTVVAPAAVLAACDQRQAEIEHPLWVSIDREHRQDVALAVVALVRGVAERHSEYEAFVNGHSVGSSCQICEDDWPCPDFEAAAAVAARWSA